jgi:uncharacterized membrane protein (UPF0127 family)
VRPGFTANRLRFGTSTSVSFAGSPLTAIISGALTAVDRANLVGPLSMHPGFLAPLVNRPDEGYSLRNAQTGEMVASRVERALDSQSRRRGLLGRDGLPDDTALVIAPSNAVHTFFMRFPIDVVFVRRNGEVLKICAAVPANRIALRVGAFAVIEMRAGAAMQANLQFGDRLTFEAHSRPVPDF